MTERKPGEPGGPDDTYCHNCGQSRIAYERGGRVQECWAEDYGEDGAYAVQLKHRWGFR